MVTISFLTIFPDGAGVGAGAGFGAGAGLAAIVRTLTVSTHA